MNYLKIYSIIIENAKENIRFRGDGNYYEKHHIIPRCMGGKDNKENLVLLTAREHFICHKLLYKGYKNVPKLYHAYRMLGTMDSNGKRYKISSGEYEVIKKLFSKYISELHKGRKFTEEHLRKLSENNPNRGGLKEDHKKAISESLMGRKLSEEHKQACSRGLKKRYETHPGTRLGKTQPKESVEKQKEKLIKYWETRSPEFMEEWAKKSTGENNANFGKPRPQEVRDKISKSHSGKILYNNIEYENIMEASKALNLSECSIRKHIKKNKENGVPGYECFSKRPKTQTQLNVGYSNRKRILFDGVEYDSLIACSKVIGKCATRVGQLLKENISKNIPGYGYL